MSNLLICNCIYKRLNSVKCATAAHWDDPGRTSEVIMELTIGKYVINHNLITIKISLRTTYPPLPHILQVVG